MHKGFARKLFLNPVPLTVKCMRFFKQLIRKPISSLMCRFCFLCLFYTAPCLSQVPEFVIEIKDHLFSPAEIEIPANTKVKLIIHNRDATSEEFESYQLNREKIIMGERKAVIFIGPLAPGNYPFFGEFNPKTAQGLVIVKEHE